MLYLLSVRPEDLLCCSIDIFMSRLWPALHSVDEIKVLASSFIEYRVDAYNSGYGFEVLSIYWFTICLVCSISSVPP